MAGEWLMIKETLAYQSVGISIGIANSRVKLIRKNNIAKEVVRIYEGDYMGMASAVGEHADEDLEQKAMISLERAVPYNADPCSESVLKKTHEGKEFGVNSLTAYSEEILSSLRSDFPQFIFSGKINHDTLTFGMENDVGLDLCYRRINTEVGVIFKHRGAGNIFDGSVICCGAEVDAPGFLKEACRTLRAFKKPLSQALTGRQKVVFKGIEEFAFTFRRNCTACSYFSGSSLFSGKLRKKIFSKRFSLLDTRNYQQYRVEPFDMEGVVRSEPEVYLVEGGTLQNVVADKRDAKRYKTTATGSAVGDIESMPTTGINRMIVKATAVDLKTILGDETAIYVCESHGSNCTASGDFAIPVQLSFLINGKGKLLGRLPQLTLVGNIFQIFGDDYMGATEEKAGCYTEENFVVTHMTVA
jgi:PmbA protein